MRYRPKSKLVVVLMIAIAVAATLVVRGLGLVTTRSALRVGYIGSGDWDSWSASYMSLHGNMERSIHPSGTLHIAVETEDGTISMTVRDRDGGVIFQEEDMGTAEYDVEASGKVTVRIEADRHRGSFAIGP